MKQTKVQIGLPVPLILLGMWCTGFSMAQDNVGRSNLVESLEVRLALIEVVVTERGDERVTDLKKEDFQVLINGKPVSIDYFNEVRDDPPAASGGSDQSETQTESQPEPINYVVFLDDYFIGRKFRKPLHTRLLDSVKNLRPRDRMAVVLFRGHRPTILVDYTNSEKTLQAAFEEAFQTTPNDRVRQLELDIPNLQLFPAGLGGNVVQAETLDDIKDNVEWSREILGKQIYTAAHAFATSMRIFADVRGRKVALVASGGWPFGAFDARFRPPREEGLKYGGVIQGDDFLNPVLQTAQSLGFTIYPMHQGLEKAGAAFDSLTEMAVHTGGKVLASAFQRKDPLQEILEDTRTFYSLGFYQEVGSETVAQDVKVKVISRPKAEVRHRDSIVNITKQDLVTIKTESELYRDTEAFSLDVELGAPLKSAGRIWDIPVSIRIPLDHVTMVQRAGQYHADLELRLIAINEKGNYTESPVLKIPIAGPKPPPGAYATYKTSFRLRKQQYEMVVSLYDPQSGNVFTYTEDYDFE